MFIKQHRKATLELDGTKLRGHFELSLTNSRDREEAIAMITEIRKQLRDFEKVKAKAKKKAKAPAKKIPIRKAKKKAKRKR